jgi:cyanophycinase-like exopeptidase
MKYSISFILSFLATAALAQDYTSYFTGDTSDVETKSVFGAVLMGGAGESDEAMTWFLERSGGGDIVVIRASGSDGYNDYMFSDLGVVVNSVETIVFNNANAADDPYVVTQLQNAEAIWMAGGDQWNYVSYWKDSPVEDAINNLLNVKQGPVGGLSAGMAVMGGSYFNAMNGTVYSDESLEDPYNQWLQLGHGDFIECPYLENVVTDTHYDDPDRRGRHVTFMARMYQDEGIYPLGIACDEYAAVCIDGDGIAWTYGEYPEFDDYVYFIRPNCPEPWSPENCSSGETLEWNRNQSALKAYRIEATQEGDKFLDLYDWITGSGGQWQDWWASNGVLNYVEDTSAPECGVGVIEQKEDLAPMSVFPNPSFGLINVEIPGIQNAISGYAVDVAGRMVWQGQLYPGQNEYDFTELGKGTYKIIAEKYSSLLIID